MATIIWCDRVKHSVRESRSEVATLIGGILDHIRDPREIDYAPAGFGYFTKTNDGKQIALNVQKISSFEARGNDPI